MPTDAESARESGSSTSSDDLLNTENDEGWEDVHEDIEEVAIMSLFDDKVFPNVIDMFEHCKEKYGFDVWQLRKDHGKLGCLGWG